MDDNTFIGIILLITFIFCIRQIIIAKKELNVEIQKLTKYDLVKFKISQLDNPKLYFYTRTYMISNDTIEYDKKNYSIPFVVEILKKQNKDQKVEEIYLNYGGISKIG